MAVTTESADVDPKNVTDWRKLFTATADQTLRFFPSQVLNGKTVVSPPFEIFEKGVEHWKNSIVAQFIGKVPNFNMFQRLVNMLWGADGVVEVCPTRPNLFIIQFLMKKLGIKY